jgi:two-component system response regulator BaeR
LLTEGTSVVTWVREHKPALILLDLMLPGKSGLDICKEIRFFSTVPIIMTTARIEEIDRLLGLELGADDYICKPYSPREVVARVKTVLRRVGNVPTPIDSGLQLDESCYRATLNGHDLQLTAAEFRLLNYLATRPGRVYNRQQLLNNIYPDERALNDRAIDNYIKNLRKKLYAVSSECELIHSVYGVGYKFELLV